MIKEGTAVFIDENGSIKECIPTVDLSLAKKGSKVYFRCGGSSELSLSSDAPGDNTILLRFYESDEPYIYHIDGLFFRDSVGPFDIIRVDTPEFDWKDVMAGMCFKRENKNIWFIGHHLKDIEYGVFSRDTDCVDLVCYYKGFFLRVPEHDIKVTP